MNIIIFGLGSIGRRHARLLNQHFPDVSLFRWRRPGSGPSLLDYVVDISTVHELQSLNSPTALISTPTDAHLETLSWLIEIGVTSFFLEKPIDNKKSSQYGKIILDNELKASKIQVFVGYPFSFLEIPEWVKEARHLKFTCLTDASKWPSKRKLDHVLFELSHELYLCEQICGPGRLERRSSEQSSFRGFFISEHGDARESRSCELHLDLAWGGTERRDIEGPDGAVFRYRADDALYLRQLGFFLGCVREGVGFGINSIEQCWPLFEKICGLSAMLWPDKNC